MQRGDTYGAGTQIRTERYENRGIMAVPVFTVREFILLWRFETLACLPEVSGSPWLLALLFTRSLRNRRQTSI